ncbi:MAG: TetR/AcrR family transcriptional regulator [Syntrophomonadaceae bacterium]|jgi:AcrR family transcriptional regulator|nr:TetR/AcrR family transcriptional regulator [Syntrophomonadaceae bacterium]
MEKFFALPPEKQKRIIDGALTVFGRNVYRKASAGDIAVAAGISKGMIFHYFGSKKDLYFYLIEFCGKLLTGEMEKRLDKNVTDFFDKLKLTTEIQISVMKQHPALLSFLRNVFFETDPEVESEIKKTTSAGVASTQGMMIEGVDLTKFKDGADPALLLKLLTWASEGLVNTMPMGVSAEDLDVHMADFYKCLDFMKNNFYKGEYL